MEKRSGFKPHVCKVCRQAVLKEILDRAQRVRTTMGSSLHNPGDMIDFLIRELEEEISHLYD